MSDERDDFKRSPSGSYDLVSHVADEAERRLRPEIASIHRAIDAVRTDVHKLAVLNESQTLDARVRKLEAWQSWLMGAVLVVGFFASTFGVMAYNKLSTMSEDVAALKVSR